MATALPSFNVPPKREMLIRVRWLGYDAAHDTHEPVGNLAEDVPDLVQTYLRANRADKACDRLLKRYFPT